jgi:MFS family permease
MKMVGCRIGGAFTDHVSWRWCFYINLPVGRTQKLRHLDLPGTALFLPAIVSLLLVLQWGGTTYAWNDGRIIALFVVFAVLLVGFAVIQWWQQDQATLPPRLMEDRNVWGAMLYAGLVSVGLFVVNYLVCLCSWLWSSACLWICKRKKLVHKTKRDKKLKQPSCP